MTLYVAGEHILRILFSVPVPESVAAADGAGASSLDAFALMGVFETEAEAVAACSERHHFVGPVTLGEAIPKGPREWPNARFPKAEE